MKEQEKRLDHSLEEDGIPDLDDSLPQKEITGDAQEGHLPPGDHPVGADEYGTTPEEMHRGEPHALRLEREAPDSDPATRDAAVQPPVGRLVDDTNAGVDDDDEEAWAEQKDDFEALTAEEEAVRQTGT